jgi:hypothetical protein
VKEEHRRAVPIGKVSEWKKSYFLGVKNSILKVGFADLESPFIGCLAGSG